MTNEDNIEVCDDCGRPLMEHATYANGFIEVFFNTENPVTDIELSDKALKRIQKIVADDLGASVIVSGVLSKNDAETRLADMTECEGG